ncbi:MAG: hypothetical protein ACR2PL_16655, partial [Dehalococcoidia bacterium]
PLSLMVWGQGVFSSSPSLIPSTSVEYVYTWSVDRRRMMQRKLTITIADDDYRGLHQQIGRGAISRFIENLVRPHVVKDAALEEEYREAACDSRSEQEALAWIEANLDEALA